MVGFGQLVSVLLCDCCATTATAAIPLLNYKKNHGKETTCLELQALTSEINLLPDASTTLQPPSRRAYLGKRVQANGKNLSAAQKARFRMTFRNQ